jgi:hypothetical protein
MLVVIASKHDEAARSLVAQWAEHDSALLTCADLSVNGWRDYPLGSDRSLAVAGGRALLVTEIAGVLTLLPYVDEAEVSQIDPADRPYVAAE